jgi:prepilin-type N-terminal cleavage/methylation domain-containing protein
MQSAFNFKKLTKGFTLIELLIVITIIGILASVVVLNSIKGAKRARDARRIQELYQIAHALQLYYSEKGDYPPNTDSGDIGCQGNWDAGNIINGADDPFIQPLVTEGFLDKVPVEQKTTGNTDWEKCSYRYLKADNPCGCTGTYAILYATCEDTDCPTGERPACCTGWDEGGPVWDAKDITIFLKKE